MRFKFGRGEKLSDVLKVATYLEKEGIAYQMLSDIEIQVGPNASAEGDDSVATADSEVVSRAKANIPDTRIRQTEAENDPLWRPGPPGSGHEDHDRSCKDPVHYGATSL